MAEVSLDSIANLSPELQRAFQAAVKAENKPLQAIEERRGFVEERVKLLDDIIGRVEGVRSLLPNLNSPIAIRELAFASGDDRLVTGTADKSEAEPGKHTMEILQLAKSASALSNRFSDSDETRIGSGYFTFTTADGDTKDIFIDDENSTLKGIARIVNDSNIGLKATVIRDESDPEAPYRLLLASDRTGYQEDVEYPEFYFIDGDEDFYIEEEREATNARLRYEGFEIESPTNEIKDLIRGVTLNLKGMTDEGKPVSVSIEQDLPKTTVKVKDLVDGLNKVFSFIQEQNTLDERSDTRRTLGGDYGIRHAEDRLKAALRENYFSDTKTVQSMYDIGIQFDRKGLLQFDEKKFQHALQSDYEQVVELLAGDGRTYTGQIDRIDQDLETKAKRAEERIETLKGRLAKAQAALSQIQNQTGFLQAQGSAPQLGIPIG